MAAPKSSFFPIKRGNLIRNLSSPPPSSLPEMAYPRRTQAQPPQGLTPPRPFFLAESNARHSSGSSEVSSLDPASDSDSPPSQGQPRAARRRRSYSQAAEVVAPEGTWSPSSLYADPTTPTIPTSALPARPPPSSFSFPFQAYPGNPDPLPPRRLSSESATSRTADDHEYMQLENAPALRKPFAPFMASSGPETAGSSTSSLPRSPSATSLYKQSAAANMMPSSPPADTFSYNLPRTTSTHSFRAPFLSPASRPSSLWAPPSYAIPLPTSPTGSTSALPLPAAPGLLPPLKGRTIMPSTRLSAPLTKEDKPWLAKRAPRTRTSYFITLLCLVAGLAGAALLCFTGVTSVPILDPSDLCIVLDEQFTSGSLDTDTWNRDVELGGFGNGEFQMTTNSDDNLFIQNGQLYIMPTLTPDDIVSGGNYTLPGCTATLGNGKTNNTACSVHTGGATVINPVQSARINTQGKKTIKYGKVEVRAKMPTGDWLWPAIWMLPQNPTYGAWPLSGEIDMVEARGNGPTYPRQGNNFVRASLNYGPLPGLVHQIFGWFSMKRQTFGQGFHTYTLEWTEDFIRISVDSRTHAMLLTTTKTDKKSYWRQGGFPATAINGTSGVNVAVEDVWSNGSRAAPFDQDFFLIIDVAVGGTSGWFPDSVGGKPWFDGSLTAMRDFAEDKDTWSKTWPSSSSDRALRVDSVKMWQKCR